MSKGALRKVPLLTRLMFSPIKLLFDDGLITDSCSLVATLHGAGILEMHLRRTQPTHVARKSRLRRNKFARTPTKGCRRSRPLMFQPASSSQSGIGVTHWQTWPSAIISREPYQRVADHFRLNPALVAELVKPVVCCSARRPHLLPDIAS